MCLPCYVFHAIVKRFDFGCTFSHQLCVMMGLDNKRSTILSRIDWRPQFQTVDLGLARCKAEPSSLKQQFQTAVFFILMLRLIMVSSITQSSGIHFPLINSFYISNFSIHPKLINFYPFDLLVTKRDQHNMLGGLVGDLAVLDCSDLMDLPWLELDNTVTQIEYILIVYVESETEGTIDIFRQFAFRHQF